MYNVMQYIEVRLKYACKVYGNPWSLWNCNYAAFFFLLFLWPSECVQRQIDSLMYFWLGCIHAVIIEIPDYGTI